ncbi:hypothetical protein CBER1_10263 [Cercospora berteroae]|uniref:Uncharacterized protein n=1 Tax=Cercospora berteroae TaxID=357750 RepID=A0A2S6BXS5_9PEZI|nr:hypothetical protein CBER1_10263 [Cercospora berteroae]
MGRASKHAATDHLITMEWPIAQILRKKVDGDRTLYQVRWKPTMLNRNEVHLGDSGISYAFFNGREWEIEDVTRCSGGVYEVTWTDTWQEYSDLAGTEDDLIADFEAGVLPPEEAAQYASAEMPFDIFVPDPNADYTDSFVAKLTDELRNGEARKWQKVPIWVACLDLPTRNRVAFRKGFMREVSHEAARTSNAIIKIKNEARNHLSKALYKPAALSAKRALEQDATQSAAKRRVARTATSSSLTPSAADRNDRLTSEQLLHDIKRETSVFAGAWDDTYVSNHIGGPADWSSPNVKEEQGQFRGDHDDGDDELEVMDADAVGPGEQSHVPEMGIRPPSSRRALEPSMHEAEERKAPSVSLRKADAKPRSAEEVRLNLLRRFKSSESSSKALSHSANQRSRTRTKAKPTHSPAAIVSMVHINYKPASQASGASSDTVTVTDTGVKTAQDLRERCRPEQWNMLIMAWDLWLQEREEEEKVQPFPSADHFFAAVWMEELRAGAV